MDGITLGFTERESAICVVKPVFLQMLGYLEIHSSLFPFLNSAAEMDSGYARMERMC